MPSGREPPTYPTELSFISEAVQLCGTFSRRGLGHYGQARLAQLCGRLPVSKTEAQRWKIYLRALWREAVAEDDD